MGKPVPKIGSGDAERFDHKYIMYRRALWDKTVEDTSAGWYKPTEHKSSKPGYTLKEWALQCASWYVERTVGRGNQLGDYGLFKWDVDVNDPACGNRLLPGHKWEVSDPAQMSKDIKRAARFLGSSLTGICKVDKRWIYSKMFSHAYDTGDFQHLPVEIPEEYEHAVVLAIEMNYWGTKTSPDTTQLAAQGNGYSMMPFVAGRLAHFIRTLGYKAIPSGNDTALSIPMAVDAGLGQLGRHGQLITKKFGPRVRIAKVFTNMPLVADKPIDFGVTEFCTICAKCAKNCPGQAIPHGEPTTEPVNISNQGGILKWMLDAEKCHTFWVKNENSSCSNCLRVCPFSKPKGVLHDTTRWFIGNIRSLDKVMLWFDDVFGYDKQITTEEFWKKMDKTPYLT